MRNALSGLTVRGRAFLAAGVAAAASALVLGQRDLLRVGVFLLALPLVSLLVVLRTRYKVSAQRVLDPGRVAVGDPANVRLVLENLARLPTGVLLVEDRVPFLLGARPRFVLDRVSSRWKREVSYPVRSDVRGRYTLGPLTLRLTDPFGLVELARSFRATDTLVVTPQVTPLPAVHLSGEWSGTGESRSRAVAMAGEEDVTIREYRDGDDLRRVHWRATAHRGDLMVRREEQPWQSRCTVLLDTRQVGHGGSGPASSFEWAVAAAASVGLHLLRRGYSVRLVVDEGLPVVSSSPEAGAESADAEAVLLDGLAVAQPATRASVDRLPALLSGGGGAAAGLLVAVFGRLDPAEAAAVARLRHGSVIATAIVLDVASWVGGAAGRSPRLAAEHQAALAVLRGAGWRVASARHGDSVATAWERSAHGAEHVPDDDLPVRQGVATGGAA